MKLKDDCRYFRGEKPCLYQRLCPDCPYYQPFSFRILIIKGRAQGDVLRTTPLVAAIKRAIPDSHLTWIVDEESVDLLTHNPHLDRIVTFSLEGVLSLQHQEFDLLLSLDKEPISTALAQSVPAKEKKGFGLNRWGNLTIFNPESEYAFQLGVDDDLKFRQNQKTYQQIIHEITGFKYQRDPYLFYLQDEDSQRANQYFETHRIKPAKLNIGLNTGSGTKFLTKQWPQDHFVQLIDLLHHQLDANVFLLGGPRETQLNRRIEKLSSCPVYNTGNNNSLREFAGFLAKMDLIVCSDTLALHLALALKRKVVALFGPTCPQEIDLYDSGIKLFTGVSCAPCYKQTCPEMTCMKSILPLEVFQAIKSLLES